jgi:hypothetical protein
MFSVGAGGCLLGLYEVWIQCARVAQTLSIEVALRQAHTVALGSRSHLSLIPKVMSTHCNIHPIPSAFVNAGQCLM